MKKKRPTLAQVRTSLRYNHRTGILYWRLNLGSQAKKGAIAGCVNNEGYISIGFCGSRYLGHRLAWFHYYGKWPSKRLDHKNEIRTANWITNLREAEHCQNLWNTKDRKNRIFPKGVSRNGTRFCARISYRNKQIWIGNFGSVSKAASAYIEAAKIYHGEFSPFNRK